MHFVVQLLIGLIVAVAAGVLGTLVVAAIEVVIAFRDPERGPVVRARNWRDNLHHMLH